MRSTTLAGFCYALTLSTCSPLLAGEPFFRGLNPEPGVLWSEAWGISADGTVVVGKRYFASGPARLQAYRWTADEGMVSLFGPQPDPFEFTWAWAVSDDGRMIVGGRGDLCRYRTTAVVWNPEEGVQDLPSISPQGYNDAFDISADGTVIVGTAGQQGVRWESGTIAALGPWRAMAVSADGSTVAGYNPGPPWMWLWQGETLSSLGAGVGLPTDLSADGSTLVGMSPELGAFRWTAQEGMVGLGPVPPSSPYWYDNGLPLAVSPDGRTIVGGARFAFEPCPSATQEVRPVPLGPAFIWDARHGMRVLQDVLVNDCGLDLSGWKLRSATAMTPDALTLVGFGENPQGQVEAWIAHLPETVEVIVDIRPGESPNNLNRKSKGVLPVAVLGSADCDLHLIDPASVKLICAGSNGGASPVSMAYEDAGAARAAGKTDRSPTQGNGPGDLVLKFRTEDVVEQLKLDALTRGETVLLSVTGKLLDGRLFAGSDLVRIVQ